MDLALIAGRDKQVAFARERHGPDVFLVRIVEQLGFAVGADFVNLAVRIGGGENLIFRIEHDGVDFEPVQLSEGPALSGAVDYEDLGRSAPGSAAGGVEVAFGVGSQGPEIRRRGIENLGEFGREKNAAVS